MNVRRYISTREEWLANLGLDDGRKWTVEETGVPDEHGNPTATYIELVEERNPWARTGQGPAALRAKKIRDLFSKKVSKDERGYTWRLGYNRLVGQYTGTTEYPELSGSSLNRKPVIAKKSPKKSPKKDGPAIHIFSDRSKSKVRDKATAFFRAIPKKDRIFLTLTFIQHVEDHEAVKILNKFLTVVRKERPGFEYLRIAEHQPENPLHTIHFHILMNRRMSIRRYNALWVLQQYNAGLIGRSDKHDRQISAEEIRMRYDHDMTAKFRKKDPDSIQDVLNPLDICKAYEINGIAAYLSKYVTKQKKEEFTCLNWHCSRKVSRLFTRQVVTPSTFAYLQSFNNFRVDYATGECAAALTVTQPFFSLINVNNRKSVLTRLRRMETVNRWLMDGFLPDTVPKLDDDLYRRIFKDPCTDQSKKVICV